MPRAGGSKKRGKARRKRRKESLPALYRKLLLRGLQVITSDPRVSSSAEAADMVAACSSAMSRLRAQREGMEFKSQFSLHFTLDITDQKVSKGLDADQSAQILLGTRFHRTATDLLDQSVELAILLPASSGHTHEDLGCCFENEADDRRRIAVRRFHFDVAPASERDPVSHLQYGGTLATAVQAHYCLLPHLECPRLPIAPMDLLLVLDLVLRQFETAIDHLPDEMEWRSVVVESESLWQAGYFAGAASASKLLTASKTATNSSTRSLLHLHLYP